MTWRRRLRRRLLWAGVLLGLVLLLVAVSALRLCAWGRDCLTDNASRLGRRALKRKEGAMTRTLTLVAIAVAAVAIAPAALGEARLVPLYPPSHVATYRDAGERPAARASLLDLASAAGRLQVSAVRDALTSYRDSGPHHGVNATPPLAAKPTYTTNPDKAVSAKLAAARTRAETIGHPPAYQASYSVDTTPETPRLTSDGGVAWSQIGIGVGLGVAFAFGLGVAVRTIRTGPLAH